MVEVLHHVQLVLLTPWHAAHSTAAMQRYCWPPVAADNWHLLPTLPRPRILSGSTLKNRLCSARGRLLLGSSVSWVGMWYTACAHHAARARSVYAKHRKSQCRPPAPNPNVANRDQLRHVTSWLCRPPARTAPWRYLQPACTAPTKHMLMPPRVHHRLHCCCYFCCCCRLPCGSKGC